MKIKKYVGPDMNLLMSRVKQELGEDAVVISTSSIGNGQTELVAAVESPDIVFDKQMNASEHNDLFIREKLARHDLAPRAEFSILSMYRRANDDLAEVFDKMFVYGNFWNSACDVKIFVGPHGSGKTTTLVKMALLAKMHNLPVKIISTDNVSAAANIQLKSFAQILGIDFEPVFDHQKLFDKVLAAQSDKYMLMIDTAAINPFLPSEISHLEKICNNIGCDKILTLDACCNAENAVAIADGFKQLGANYFFPTKLDLTQRMGSVLSVSAINKLQLGYAGVGAGIANGIARVSNESLARLILE